ncbi:uncharacterized protein CLUP02_14071 [Colletotrichum lupini]|uniref:Uncharacterized protein n=1 Tax=Colletotrichum lupini TaxID=145971 RepID=A0A9Q8T3J7_9PEZI|nr:uncharacterized protein CLUP02_14071 [Colletotrichum lupini]UQC88546.1 hypothetical protein CLUP02_14071 [Colletotrichum lupini]
MGYATSIIPASLSLLDKQTQADVLAIYSYISVLFYMQATSSQVKSFPSLVRSLGLGHHKSPLEEPASGRPTFTGTRIRKQ